MPLATLRIDAKTHRRLKAQAHRSGHKIGRLAEQVLDQWLAGERPAARECAVEPHGNEAKS